MLEQTINGVRVTIIHNVITNTYFVYTDEGMVEMTQRPVTDQEAENLEREREEQIINNSGRMLGNMLVELMMPLLRSDSGNKN